MSTATRIRGFTVDWITGALVLLTAAFQAQVLRLVYPATKTPAAAAAGQSTSATDGVSLLAVAAVEIALLLLAWRVYNRLPERWQQRIKSGLRTLVAPVLWLASLFGSHKWIAFNMAAFLLGAIITAVLALSFAPAIALLIMAVMTVYDLAAVNFSAVMGDLVTMSSNVGLPNFIVIPTTLDFELQTVKDYINSDMQDSPESIAFIIGVGDFVFPAFLVASTFITLGVSLPVVGASIGTLGAAIVLRDSMARADSGLPALPWLNTGAVCGFAVGVVLSGRSLWTVLGL